MPLCSHLPSFNHGKCGGGTYHHRIILLFFEFPFPSFRSGVGGWAGMIFLLALRRDGGQVDSRIGKICLAGEKAAAFLQKSTKLSRFVRKKLSFPHIFPPLPAHERTKANYITEHILPQLCPPGSFSELLFYFWFRGGAFSSSFFSFAVSILSLLHGVTSQLLVFLPSSLFSSLFLPLPSSTHHVLICCCCVCASTNYKKIYAYHGGRSGWRNLA